MRSFAKKLHRHRDIIDAPKHLSYYVKIKFTVGMGIRLNIIKVDVYLYA